MTTYGLTPQGFVICRQDDIKTALQAAFVDAFGATTSTSDETVFGQLIGIFSEREALIWEALEDTVAQSTIQGAEGVYVDNLLALVGLARQGASPTRTNPTPATQADGRVLYGLVLFGTPGTVVPAGATLQTTTQPTATFALDAPVTIAPPANALQRIFFSNTPDAGTFALKLVAPSGDALTTGAIPYAATAQSTQILFSSAPSSGSYVLSVGQAATAALAFSAAAAQVQAAIQALSGYATAGVQGNVAQGFVVTWPQGPIPPVQVNGTALTFSSVPVSGAFTLSLNGNQTAPLDTTTQAPQMQAAIQALPGFARVGVTGSFASGFQFHWGFTAPPTVAVSANTTGVTATVGPLCTLNVAPTILNPVQAYINGLVDSGASSGPPSLPFTDATVTSPTAGQLALAFGANTPSPGQPASGAQAQATLVVAANSLAQSGSATNLAVVVAVMGAPAQGLGSATCNATGPTIVPAGALSVIGSSQTGWTGVTNQLDCLSGRALETDTEAMARRNSSLSAKGTGPLAATVQAVEAVPDVSAVLSFQNTSGAALQRLVFQTTPTSGSFALGYGGQVTQALPYNATAAQVQSALAALKGLSALQVSGSAAYGYTVDFNGSFGGQAAQALFIASDTTGAQLGVTFGRPPKSIELVVEGGEDTAIAQAILSAAPGGIATYGAPASVTTAAPQAGSTALPCASVAGLSIGLAALGQGIAPGSVIVGLSGNVATLSLPALSTLSGVQVTFNHTVFLNDAAGNPQQVSFSRPQQVAIYVSIALVTDLYLTPGDASSGRNPNAKFDPATVSNIQSDIIAIGNGTPIGGLIVARGTNGLVGAFNGVAGIVDYTLAFGAEAQPTNTQSLQLQAEQAPLFSSFTTNVSYT